MNEWRSTIRGLLSSHSHSQSLEESYTLLSADERGSPNGHYHPTNGHVPRRRSAKAIVRSCCTFRRALVLAALIPVLLTIVILWRGIPPSFADIREFEG